MNDDQKIDVMELFKNRVNMYKRRFKLERRMKELLNKQFLLRTTLKTKQEEKLLKKGKPVTKDFVFTLSKGDDCFFELLQIGKLAEGNLEKWHNAEFIYPIGYKARRVYVPYKPINKDKMEYICEISEDGLSIKSDDGKIWRGATMWKDFVSCFSPAFEFKCMEHFFGLNYKPILYKIEKLGDISMFNNYILFEERKRKM
ncbi:Histone-lysine N-methyltransferase trr [Nosema granulosis]|uniref:Histone-lysine N-methyltransferase trr n=1 Tax=Nosema granulosis TaxID=83296 RepID=A0A9P6KYY6_9MICR|nr:Histone-lysine N-methyltransferase trr [Nosema granulosis]